MKSNKKGMSLLLSKSELTSISKTLTGKQKEVIKLLQNKEVLVIKDKDVLITSGKVTKKVTPHTFYNIVNKGLVVHQTEWPYNYELSIMGKTIKLIHYPNKKLQQR